MISLSRLARWMEVSWKAGRPASSLYSRLSHEEFTRLAETRLAQNNIDYLEIA